MLVVSFLDLATSHFWLPLLFRSGSHPRGGLVLPVHQAPDGQSRAFRRHVHPRKSHFPRRVVLLIWAICTGEKHVPSDSGPVYGGVCADVGVDPRSFLLGCTRSGSLVSDHDHYPVYVLVLLCFIVHPIREADGVADVRELLGAGA